MADTRNSTDHPVKRDRVDTRHRTLPDHPNVTVERTYQSPDKIACRCGSVMLPIGKDTYACSRCNRRVKTVPY